MHLIVPSRNRSGNISAANRFKMTSFASQWVIRITSFYMEYYSKQAMIKFQGSGSLAWETIGLSTELSKQYTQSVNYQCTVVTFLMYLGLKVTTWVLVDIISNSLSNIIKCTMTRYYKQKYLRFSSKNTSKIMKKRFFGSNRVWTGDLEIMKPAC